MANDILKKREKVENIVLAIVLIAMWPIGCVSMSLWVGKGLLYGLKYGFLAESILVVTIGTSVMADKVLDIIYNKKQ